MLSPFRWNGQIDLEYVIFVSMSFFTALIVYFIGRTDKNDYKNLTATKRKITLESEFKEDNGKGMNNL